MPVAPDPIALPSTSPKLRSFADRVRQIALFELGGLALITPPFAWASGVAIADSIGLLTLIALIAAVWNGSYNFCFDWVEGRLTGRPADHRPFRLRALHAIGFEGGLLLMSLPVIMAWTAMGWLEALLADLGLASAYVLYAFAFNLAYDRIFPIEQNKAVADAR
ncbi:PACE efflux transporter [Aromatoleum sp.]|uniref:PACE efflux transporter n=1 Tax=Aromatoleum sp. TaxID=2307007 RepID=UPI002FC72483